MVYCYHCVGEIEDVNGSFCPHCGKKYNVYYPQSNEIPPGTYLNNGRYFVGRSIGAGGFGITYIGFDTKLNKKVVIKETFYNGLFQRNCNDKSVDDPLQVKYDKSVDIDSIMAKTKKECYSLSKAESLNNIVKVYDWFNENNTAYIIIEYINGETFIEKIRRDGRYTWPDLYSHIKPLMQSLCQLHHEGMLHRDIKPHNIMLRNTYSDKVEFVLIDFGLARTNQNATLATRGISFSPGYSPLEQRTLSKKDGTYTDVYAIAATLYTALSGEEPSFDMYETVDENFPKLELLRNFEDVPDYVVDTLRYALQPDNRIRCQTLDEFLERLENKPVDNTVSKARNILPQIEKNNSKYYSGETIAAHYKDDNSNSSFSQNSSLSNDYPTQSKYFGDHFNNTRHTVEDINVTKKSSKAKLIASAAALIAVVGLIWGLNFQNSIINVPSMEDNNDTNSVSRTELAEQIVEEDTEKNDVDEQEKKEESSQTEYVIMPDLYGLKIDTAKNMILSLGLKYKTVEEESDRMEANHILSQAPAADDKIEKGKVVNLVVAKAKKKTETDKTTSSKAESVEVQVPNVTNLSCEEAEKQLTEIGLIPEISGYLNSDNVEENHVIKQSPASGKVSKQSKVSLWISKGVDSSVVKVDSYTGQNINSVKNSLEEKGIRVMYSYVDRDGATGSIVSQSAAPGSTIKNGDTIIFGVVQPGLNYSFAFFTHAECSSEMGGFAKEYAVYYDDQGKAWSPNNSGGVGEYLVYSEPKGGGTIPIVGFYIDNGVTTNNEEFSKNGRITSLRFEFSDGYSETVQLSDVMTHQKFYLDHVVNTSSIKVIITGSTPGTVNNNPCLSLIIPFT